ncbi:alpha/beta fold hydrolase [Oceaniglobus trochenteri]|uniref:alpha/beta fold hydrolase n=1 Tax=Oceaniglobus trochenteri TaxID=2763260 RepID=UPI001CFFADCE|nr:alpha/beta hydrolase [Oceaniglobus trochenteri]
MTFPRLAVSLVAAAALAGCGVFVDDRADRREALAEEQYPPEGRFVTVEGRRVHYVEAGQGPDLILIHGASGSTRDFSFRFIDRVKDRYHVIAFDRPGLGYTDRISEAFSGATNTAAESPRQQAAFLKAAADKLGVQRPIVLGHSYGGAVALAWGLDHDPAALVVVSAASNPWPGGLGALYNIASSAFGGAAIVPLITAFAPTGQVKSTIESIFEPQEPPPGYAEYVGPGLTLRRASFRANARQVNSLRPHVVEMSKHYGDLTMPVEILHGTADDIVPLDIHSEPLSRQVPGATLTRLEGIGHMPHHVVPDAVTDAIDRAAKRAGLR